MGDGSDVVIKELGSNTTASNVATTPSGVPENLKDIARLLEHALAILNPTDATPSSSCSRLQSLWDRLSVARFQLAVLGQFKRGKSTLLNALLGAPLLPAGIVPLTAVPIFITWGEKPLVRVSYGERVRVSYGERGRVEEFAPTDPDEICRTLFDFVAEEGNPRNRRGVARVDLRFPAPLLESGIVLIDTPGIGSTHRHNSDAALAVLPECDAALFVVSADPPITEAELTYLDAVRPHVAYLAFVLNKADCLAAGDLQIAIGFLRRTLEAHIDLDEAAPIISVSALHGMKAKREVDADALRRSGIDALEARLLRDMAQRKLALLRTAAIQKASGLLGEASVDLALGLRALEMPVLDLERCAAALAEVLPRFAAEKQALHDLLAGDQRRLVAALEDYAEGLRRQAREHLLGIVAQVIVPAPDDRAKATEQAVAAAIPLLFEARLCESQHEFADRAAEVLARHQHRIDNLVNVVRRAAAELFDVAFVPAAPSEPFHIRRQPYWVTRQWNNGLALASAGLLVWAMPRRLREARLRQRLERRLEEIIDRNVENLRWALLQSLQDIFRQFGAVLDERFAGAIAAAQSATTKARLERSETSERTAAAVARLRHAVGELDAIRSALAALQVDDESRKR